MKVSSCPLLIIMALYTRRLTFWHEVSYFMVCRYRFSQFSNCHLSKDTHLVMILWMQEPFECYHMSDIEAGLGLERKHLIAIALLVGTDHDLNGVQGIGIDTALRFVRSFHEDEIMDRFDVANFLMDISVRFK